MAPPRFNPNISPRQRRAPRRDSALVFAPSLYLRQRSLSGERAGVMKKANKSSATLRLAHWRRARS